jgi:hypothetical protein
MSNGEVIGEVHYLEETAIEAFTWNYRLAKITDEDGVHYGIVEAYYDGGRMIGWTEEGQGPWGETEDEIAQDFSAMSEAFNMPVIDLAQIGRLITNKGPGEPQ